MEKEYSLRCACGQVQGRLIGNPGLRLRCWCNSCRRFARWMESRSPGCMATCVDDTWGTQAFQCYRDQVFIERGRDQIQPVKLNARSNTIRYIAGCCHTILLAATERPAMVPIVPVFAGFLASPDEVIFDRDFDVFAARRVKWDQPGHPSEGRLHWPFLGVTLTRVLGGILKRHYRPSPLEGLSEVPPLIPDRDMGEITPDSLAPKSDAG